MNVRDEIMDSVCPYGSASALYPAWEYGLIQAADIAEAREKELLAEKAALIAELRSQIKPNATYLVVDLLVLNSILAKYEGKP
jgi:hypothetical protein